MEEEGDLYPAVDERGWGMMMKIFLWKMGLLFKIVFDDVNK